MDFPNADSLWSWAVLIDVTFQADDKARLQRASGIQSCRPALISFIHYPMESP